MQIDNAYNITVAHMPITQHNNAVDLQQTLTYICTIMSNDCAQ